MITHQDIVKHLRQMPDIIDDKVSLSFYKHKACPFYGLQSHGFYLGYITLPLKSLERFNTIKCVDYTIIFDNVLAINMKPEEVS